MARKHKPLHPWVRELPFSYSETDKKQAKLYLILLHLRDGCLSRGMFEELRRHIFGMVRFGLKKADREDIFMTFVASVYQSRTIIQPWMTNRFVRQRFINAVRDYGKRGYLLREDFQDADEES